MLGLGGVEGKLALVEVGNQRAVAEGCEPFCHAFDLIVQTPPFLDDNHTRGLIIRPPGWRDSRYNLLPSGRLKVTVCPIVILRY